MGQHISIVSTRVVSLYNVYGIQTLLCSATIMCKCLVMSCVNTLKVKPVSQQPETQPPPQPEPQSQHQPYFLPSEAFRFALSASQCDACWALLCGLQLTTYNCQLGKL